LQAQSALTGPLAATMELHLPDVAPLAVLAAQDARGAATFKAQLSRDGAETQWSLDADAAFTGGKAVWVAALGDRATLQLTGTLNDRGLDLDQLHLGGRALQLSLNGSATRAPAGAAAIKDLHARWALSVTDLSALSPLLAGELNASGQLSGPAAALSAEAQLSSTLSVRGSPSGTVSASLTVRGLPATPSGTLRAAGMLDGAPLDVDVELERPGGREMRAAKAKADWKSAHLEGEATFANSLAESQGQLRLQIGALGDLSRLLGLELRGAAGGSVDFKPASGHTEAQIRFAATNLVAGSVAGNLQLSGAGTAEALALQFGLQMPALHGAPASLSGQARLDLDTRQLRVDTLLGEYRGESLHLESPAAISFADGLSLEPVKLADQQSFLSLEGRLAPTLDLRAALHLPGPAVINALRPQLLASGAFEADAELHGTLSAPSGSVHVNGTGIRSVDQEANELPPVNVHAAAQLAGDSGTLDAKIDAGAASTLAVTGTFPLGADGALGLKIAGALDVGLINPVLEAGGQHAAGDLSVDATVNGTPSAPQIGGTIRLAKGSLRDYQLGLNLSNISAEVFGTQAMLQIKTFTASAASGNLAVTGTFGVLQPGMPLDLKITAKNAEPIVSKIVTANLNADVRINGTLREHLDVTGAIHLNKTTIGIPDALPPDVAVLDVRRRGTGAPAPAAKPLVIALDLALQAPQQMLLAGRGLNAELGGEVHIAGTTDDPVVTGGFDLQRGSFSLASSRLNFTAGRVSFDGAGLRNKIDPTLDFTAETAVSNGSSTATVTLRITGLADAPRFDFTSSPSLPQDEIMAELLFGESPAQLSALQVAEIGAALATLSGVGDNGVNPLSKLQKTLGLDRLAVGTASTGTTPGAANQGTSIEAGRYVTKHVYVEAKQTTTGVSQVQVDVDLTNHLKLQTRLGNGTAIVQGTTPENDPGSSVGLSYQFEY
jgi:translocation and assembly module TamB